MKISSLVGAIASIFIFVSPDFKPARSQRGGTSSLLEYAYDIGQKSEMDTSIVNRVVEQLKIMPQNLQQQVLEFARTLAGSTKGVPGQQLLRFAGAIPTDDIQLMRKAIEQDCEQVDTSEW